MKSNLVFFLGLFAALGISWAGIVLGSNAQLGSLAPYYDDGQGTAYPEWMPGVAARGQLVYRDLGCAACHTQQVRRPDFGSDKARGWGDRQSVARDYIYQPFPQLGLSRTGPDLANFGDRKPTAMDSEDILRVLYAGSQGMPSYRFLFEKRQVGTEAQLSDEALKLTGALEPKAGWEIVPTARALDLAGYLVNSKTVYDYPEAVPVAAPAAPGEKPAAAAAPSPATPPVPAGAAAQPAAGTPAAPQPSGATATAPGPAGTGSAAPAATVSPTPASGAAAPAAAAPATAGTAAQPAAGTPAAPQPSGAAATAPGPAGAGSAAPAATVSPTPAGGPAQPAAVAPAPGGTAAPAAAPAAPAPASGATPSPAVTPTPTAKGGAS